MAALREVFADFLVVFDRRGTLARGNQAVTRTAQNLRRLSPIAEAATNALNRFAIVVGGIQTIRSIGRFIAQTIRIGDQLDKVSQQLGLTVQELQEFQLAAELGGVQAEQFHRSMAMLQQKAFQASRGGAEAGRLFRELGVEVRDANGNLRTGADLLQAVGQGLMAQENPTQRVAIANMLMGETGQRLLPMFASMKDGSSALRAELERLGGGMSEDAVRRSVQLTDSLTRLRVGWTSLRSALAVRVIPALDWVVRKLTSLGVWLSNVTDSSHILEVALAGVAAAGVLAFSALIGANPVIAAVMGIVAALGFVVLLIDDIIVGMGGGKSVTREWVDELGALVGVADAGAKVFKAIDKTVRGIVREIMRVHSFVAGLARLPAFIDTEQFGERQSDLYTTGGQLRQSAVDTAGSFWESIGGRGLADVALGRLAGERTHRDRGRAPNAMDVEVTRIATERRRAALQAPAPTATARPMAQTVTQTVDAPMTVEMTINEATDAAEVERRARTVFRQEGQRQIREIQGAMIPQGEANNA